MPVLPAGRIQIRGIEGVLCKTHTCFNQLDVPFTSLALQLAEAKARFFERLELAMATLDYGST